MANSNDSAVVRFEENGVEYFTVRANVDILPGVNARGFLTLH